MDHCILAVLAMTADGSLYPSSADMSSTALIFLPDTSPTVWAMDVESMQE